MHGENRLRLKKLANRLCPICDNGTVEVLFKLDMITYEKVGLPTDHSIVTCEDCGFVYDDCRATLWDYERYYKLFNKYNSSPTILDETKELFAHYYQILNQFVDKESLIMDMGCAGGFFLDLLKENGYSHLVGIDPSEDCVRHMREKGIEAYVGSIYSNRLRPLENRFDLIILSGVMEHLFDLRNALQNLGRYLRERAIIFIGVPDTERYCNYDNALSYYFNFEHINHFSSVSLRNLMGKFKYTSIKTSFHDIKFGESIAPIFSSLYKKDSLLSNRCEKDTISSVSIEKYLDLFKDERGNNLKIIDELLESNEEIIIWGAGCVASELLSTTGLKHCNIKAFVDKDPGKHGKHLLGKTIWPINRLCKFSGTIVVCAALYTLDIINDIKNMNLNNRVLVLK